MPTRPLSSRGGLQNGLGLAPLVLTTVGLVLGALAVGHGAIAFESALMPGAPAGGPAALQHLTWFFNDFLRHEGIPLLWAGTIAFFIARGRGTLAGLFALAILVGPLNALLKEFYDRPRPLDGLSPLGYPGDASFPSGHTMTAMAFFGLWWAIAPQVLGARATVAVRLVAAAMILLTGFSRVWVLAHWPTDIIAGGCFGAALVAALAASQTQVAALLASAKAAVVAVEWHLATGIPLRQVWEAAPILADNRDR